MGERSMTRPPSQVPSPPVVPAAADSQREVVLTSEVNAIDDIGHISTARDQRRAAVDHAVVDLTRCLIAGVPRLDQRTAQACVERLHDGSVQ